MSQPSFDDRNIIGLFWNQYEQRFEGSFANRLSLFNGASDRAVESYGIFGANPVMREWIGARQSQVLDKKQYEIRNRKWESTLVVPVEDLDRDKSGLLEARIGAFAGEVAADHWEDMLIDLINANGDCYDGQSFFDTDHQWGDSGVQKNALTASEIPSANVATSTAPTPLEMANIILETTAYMLGYKNDKGRDVNGNAREFEVVVATPALFSAAMQAVNNGLLIGLVDNPLTGMKAGGFRYNVRMIPRLTNATNKVRLFRTDGLIKPFIIQEEETPRSQLLGRDSEFCFDNDAIALGVKCRRGAGYGEWATAAEVTLS